MTTPGRIRFGGPFSDGGYRLRIVTAGQVADPAPSSQADVIFDSDWGEMWNTAYGWYGTQAISGSGTITITFPSALSYIPFSFWAQYMPAQTISGVTYGPYWASGRLSNFLSDWSNSSGFLLFTYNDHIDIPAAYSQTTEVAYCIVFTDIGASVNAGASRANTHWASMGANGLYVTKPGVDFASAGPNDWLIDADSANRPLQCALAMTLTGVSGLPTVNVTSQTFPGSTFPAAVVTHGLGYIPIFWADQNIGPNATGANVYVDATNVYIVSPYPTPSSPLSFAVFAKQWA